MIWFWIPAIASLLLAPAIANRMLRYVAKEYKEKHDHPIGW